MSNLAGWKNFLEQYYARVFLGVIIFFVLSFSISTLTTKPRIWIDETVTLELARGFSRLGILDIQIAPDKFSGFPQFLQSTGYPLTIALALIFKFFGYNFTAVRIFMLLLMVIALLAVYFFGKSLFGKNKSLLSVILIASFASFYGSGRTAVGEIPGFIFLLSAIYFWLNKSAYYWSGLFLGLAIVTKPAVFLLAFPAIIFAFFLEGEIFFQRLLKIILGMAPAAIGWIFLVPQNPFLKDIWFGLFNFYRNPYSSEITANVTNNLLNFLHSPTLIYFGVLFILILFGWYYAEDKKIKSLYNFVVFYCLLAFIYYLRSPGWLRYILIAELLIFILLPWTLSEIFLRFGKFISKLKINNEQAVIITSGFLIVIQFARLFTGAQIFHSVSEIKTASYINDNFSQKSVGILDSPKLSVLLRTDKRYQAITLAGIPAIGNNSFLINHFPDVLVFASGQEFSEAEIIALKNYYSKAVRIDGYEIYGKF
ncbi:MAG: glycosyltransferase family 39 protein [Candidatus Harrisonbacteria bacterium]|nr:glycosyltransferase family 39 protein [Candidatus Harrisonbacteria bacterium]